MGPSKYVMNGNTPTIKFIMIPAWFDSLGESKFSDDSELMLGYTLL